MCGWVNIRGGNLYPIYFYKNKWGVEPVAEYLRSLATHKNKDSRIKYIREIEKAKKEIKEIEDND